MHLLRLVRSLLLTAGAVLLPASALHAQGIVTGTVVDDLSGSGITGVVVRIDALNREVLTDRAGRFALTGIPAGRTELVTRYIGYAPVRTTVTVVSGQPVVTTIRLRSAVTDLGTLVVTATRGGQAAALNQQQNAANVTNVVAADQIGRFPDANIGDALKRVPGVTVALDQGEARFGSIRGTEPRFNSVMVNGERVPSAEAEVRQVQLDLIPADMVQAVEVNKTLTPEMDADAIGGSVNIVTRAAPAGFRLSSTVGSGYNWIRNEPVLLGSVVVGSRFLNDRLGVIASGSYYDQQFGSDNKEGVWDKTGAGAAYMNEFDTRRYDVQRIRKSVSGSVDYRFDATNTVMLRAIYNNRNDWENRFRARYIFGAPNAAGVSNTEIRRQTKGGGPEDRLKATRLEDQRTQSYQLSGEHLIGKRATLTWSGTTAKASETRPDERYIDWRVRNVGFTADFSDEQNPQFTPVNAALVAPDRYTFRRIEQLESFTEDKDRNARVDLLLPLTDGDRGTRLKVGARYRDKEKVRDNSYNFAAPVNAAGFANLTLQDNADFTTDRNYAGNYQYGVFTTPARLAALDLFNTTQFTLTDQPGEYAAGNFSATEKITAGYGQIEQQLGPTLSLIAGARVERTVVDYNGFEFNVDDETISGTTGGQSYTDVLPGINLRWQAAPATVVRAAWTNSLARPNYYDLVPYRAVSIDDDELATGNPALKPTRAMNFDLSAERYLPSVGLVSVGLFHKEIDDFIYNFTSFNEVDPVTGRIFSQVSQPRNGAEARLTGAEFAYQRQLDFLPGVLKYVGLYVNYTWTDSKVSGLNIAGREDEDLPLLGTAKHSGNVSVSYDGPRLTMRLAVNYQSESLDAGEGGYNEDAFFDRYADRRTDVDANATYALTPKARFFVEANNLNNRPLRYYQGVRRRLAQDEFYGRRVQTGLKIDF